jgi:hypothetical protein
MLGLIKGMWLGSLWVIITRETYQRLGRVRCIVAITPMWAISVCYVPMLYYVSL